MNSPVILTIGALIVGLYTVDRGLAALERAELEAEATHHYQEGERKLAAGDGAGAATEFARAHTLARTDRRYRLSLARALTAAGRLDAAETALDEMLDQDSNDGPTNLAMARLKVKQDHAREADSFYHRALYGAWRGKAPTDAVRVELAEYLASKGLRQELLAELLLLDDHDASAAGRIQVARLLLAAGSPGRAAETYRRVLKEDAGNLEAETGLGEAALAQGDFHAASRAFVEALRRRPGETSIISRLKFAAMLSGMDPTPRRLASREKFERSGKVLGLARDSLARCLEGREASDEDQERLKQAEKALAEATRATPTNERSEDRLTLAEQLWRARVAACGASTGDAADPLPPLMYKLTQ